MKRIVLLLTLFCLTTGMSLSASSDGNDFIPIRILDDTVVNCNGYFTSGVFKTRQAVMSDGLGQSMNSNYWYAFNTITYENPNL